MALEGKKVGFIGAGQCGHCVGPVATLLPRLSSCCCIGMMAEAMVKGLLKVGYEASSVTASDAYQARLTYMAKECGINTTTNNLEVVAAADIVVLAVKPHIVPLVLDEVNAALGEKLVVSIAAGVTLDKMQSLLKPDAHVIRVMPNTPALVGQGAAAFCLGTNATAVDQALVEALLGSVCPVCISSSCHVWHSYIQFEILITLHLNLVD